MLSRRRRATGQAAVLRCPADPGVDCSTWQLVQLAAHALARLGLSSPAELEAILLGEVVTRAWKKEMFREHCDNEAEREAYFAHVVDAGNARLSDQVHGQDRHDAITAHGCLLAEVLVHQTVQEACSRTLALPENPRRNLLVQPRAQKGTEKVASLYLSVESLPRTLRLSLMAGYATSAPFVLTCYDTEISRNLDGHTGYGELRCFLDPRCACHHPTNFLSFLLSAHNI